LESEKPKTRTGKCVPDSSGNGKFSRKPDFPSEIVNPAWRRERRAADVGKRARERSFLGDCAS
jgi:hypothetical protein